MTKCHSKSETLQKIFRSYMYKLRYMAKKHGLEDWLDKTIKENKNGECIATEKEVNALSRLVDDERLERNEIPKILNKSYRQCNEMDLFCKIRKLKRVGIYSKISTLLLNEKINGNT